MANLFSNVQPGDLISATFMNQLLAEVQSLEDRVTALEGGSTSTTDGAPQITAISPASNLHVQDELRVYGRNFGLPGTNQVTVGNQTVNTLEAGSSDSLLLFQIPPIVVPTGGQNVVLIVANSKGSASTNFTLLPAQATLPTGNIPISLTPPPGITFAAGQKYIFTYKIVASTTVTDTYDLLPSVDQTGWLATIVDSSGNPIASPSVNIPAAPPATPVTLTGNLQVTIPAAATGSAHVKVTIRSRLSPSFFQTSGDVVVTIGSTPVNSPNITIVPAPVPPRNLDTDGRTILVPAAGISVPFNVSVVTTGSYAAAARFDNDPTHWNATVGSPIAITGSVGPATVQVAVTVLAGASPSNVYLKMTSQTDTTQATEVSVPVKAAP